ncbi:MAG: DUF3575 domain-containing protein [Bacteroidia bacterium]
MKILKSLFFVSFLLLGAASVANSQSSTSPLRKNVFKVNIIPPLLSATSEISYERFVKPNLSIVAGFGANWSADRSDFQLNSNADLAFLNTDIQNRYFLAEVRRYIDFSECNTPYGFYTGGFMRYRSIDYSADAQFGNSITKVSPKVNLEYRALNFGILLGYQVHLKNNWHFDFEFLGVGYSPNRVRFNSSITLSSGELSRLSDALNQNFGIGGNYRDIELNSRSLEFNFWYWTVRYGVSIGYSF